MKRGPTGQIRELRRMVLEVLPEGRKTGFRELFRLINIHYDGFVRGFPTLKKVLDELVKEKLVGRSDKGKYWKTPLATAQQAHSYLPKLNLTFGHQAIPLRKISRMTSDGKMFIEETKHWPPLIYASTPLSKFLTEEELFDISTEIHARLLAQTWALEKRYWRWREKLLSSKEQEALKFIKERSYHLEILDKRFQKFGVDRENCVKLRKAEIARSLGRSVQQIDLEFPDIWFKKKLSLSRQERTDYQRLIQEAKKIRHVWRTLNKALNEPEIAIVWSNSALSNRFRRGFAKDSALDKVDMMLIVNTLEPLLAGRTNKPPAYIPKTEFIKKFWT